MSIKLLKKKGIWAVKGHRHWKSGIVCCMINFRMGIWPPVVTVLQGMQSQTEKTQYIVLLSVILLLLNHICFIYWQIGFDSQQWRNYLLWRQSSKMYSVILPASRELPARLISHVLLLKRWEKELQSRAPSWLYRQRHSWAFSVRAQTCPAVVGNWEWSLSYHSHI